MRCSLLAFSRPRSVCRVEFRRFATLRSIVCHPAYAELIRRCEPVRREKFSLSKFFFILLSLTFLTSGDDGSVRNSETFLQVLDARERARWTYKKNTVLELTNRGKFRRLPDSCNIPVSEYCSIRLLPVFSSALYTLVWAGLWTADVYLDYMLVA
jgi:hypothetical protein